MISDSLNQSVVRCDLINIFRVRHPRKSIWNSNNQKLTLNGILFIIILIEFKMFEGRFSCDVTPGYLPSSIWVASNDLGVFGLASFKVTMTYNLWGYSHSFLYEDAFRSILQTDWRWRLWWDCVYAQASHVRRCNKMLNRQTRPRYLIRNCHKPSMWVLYLIDICVR